MILLISVPKRPELKLICRFSKRASPSLIDQIINLYQAETEAEIYKFLNEFVELIVSPFEGTFDDHLELDLLNDWLIDSSIQIRPKRKLTCLLTRAPLTTISSFSFTSGTFLSSPAYIPWLLSGLSSTTSSRRGRTASSLSLFINGPFPHQQRISEFGNSLSRLASARPVWV